MGNGPSNPQHGSIIGYQLTFRTLISRYGAAAAAAVTLSVGMSLSNYSMAKDDQIKEIFSSLLNELTSIMCENM